MDETETVLPGVKRSAAAGARTMTRSESIVQEAMMVAVERWEAAVLAKKPVANWGAWAFRVGVNAARKLLGTTKVIRVLADETLQCLPEGRVASAVVATAAQRRRLRRQLRARRHLLRGRQYEVLMTMTGSGMTFRGAAKKLGMTRGNVRRSFRSGLERLRPSTTPGGRRAPSRERRRAKPWLPAQRSATRAPAP